MTDWRGSDLIKINPTKADQYRAGQSFVQTLAHRRRQADGTNMSRAGGRWAKATKALCIEHGRGRDNFTDE
jgi:hypothetical protein